jgi:outer membrane receptor protein involved in Fe transport
VNDLVAYTPGLNVSRVAGGTQIAIRGIFSGAGASTTGIYIDETPIQVRNLGYGAANAFPALFDLDRVEVLRGPQGTMFGAGAEGGALRFIQTAPSLQTFTNYGRAEVAQTQGGGLSYEGGAALGGALIQDVLGFRASVYFRRDGGYIDGVNGTFKTLDRTGAQYSKSIEFDQTGVSRPNMNWSNVLGYRAALKWAASDTLTITPSMTYQLQHNNEGTADFYWNSASDPGHNQFSRPVNDAGDPATNALLNPLGTSNRAEGFDHFALPALLVNWQLGPVELISNTSYFDRNAQQFADATSLYEFLFVAPRNPGYKAAALTKNGQHNFVEEIRLQSTDANARLVWVAGAFYSRNRQDAYEEIGENFLANAPVVAVIGDPLKGVTNGPPFGNGASAFLNYYGVPPLAGAISWTASMHTVDEQKAGFVQADFKLTPELKITGGLRVSRSSLALNADYGGPENNLNYAAYVYPGQVCPAGAPCTPAVGPFAAAYPTSNIHTSETQTTPKLGVSYQLNDNNLLYASAAKGFRPAGASLLVPVTVCGIDLSKQGYLTPDGKSTQNPVFESDSVWSYEIGAKNRFWGGRLALDSSVYRIKWSNIQTNVRLPTCGEGFDTNMGHATSQGLDLGLRAALGKGLSLSATFGYNKTTFDSDSLTPNGTVLYPKGSGVPGAGAPVTASLSPQYDFSVLQSRRMYVRADYSYSGRYREAGNTAPGSSAYNALYLPIRAYSMLNLRLGTTLLGDAADLSVFVNNASNTHPEIFSAQGGFYGGYSAVWSGITLRPRTYGITLTYRH